MRIVEEERRAFRTRFYYAVAASLLVIFIGWWLGSMLHLTTMNDRILAIGRLFGLLAGWSIVLEVILMSRIPFIEYAFDLQDINDLHRLNGYSLLVTISGHFAFLLVAYASPLHVSLIAQSLAFLGSGYEDVLWATLGTAIFFGAGALSIYAIRTRMRYEWWYLIHLTIYGAIALSFLHEIALGGDLIGSFWFTAYWYALYILTFVLWLWYRLIRPFWLLSIYRFQVASVEKTARDIYSIIITGKGIKDFYYRPGQYATWRFFTKDLWYEAHPFSFSSVPGTDTIRLTVKVSKELTGRIKNLTKGDWVLVDGPRGNFTADRAETSEALLIAGGIGITPFISNIRDLLRNGKKVSLLYAVRSVEDIAFQSELRQFESMGLKVSCFIDDRGQRITDTVIANVVSPNATVFICGPDGMSKSLVDICQRHGVAVERIVTERFSY